MASAGAQQRAAFVTCSDAPRSTRRFPGRAARVAQERALSSHPMRANTPPSSAACCARKRWKSSTP